MRGVLVALSLTAFSVTAIAAPDWQAGISIPAGGRANPYELPVEEFSRLAWEGKLHAQIYPIEISGILPPYYPIKNFVEDENSNPLKEIFRQVFSGLSGIKTFNQILAKIGLHPYPKETDVGVYAVPYPNGKRPETQIGFGLIERAEGTAFTVSCAGCHSANLFGKTVLGMTNRFPHANEVFILGKQAASIANPTFFQIYNHATDGETDLLRRLKTNARRLGVMKPLRLGLDTSLAQVALSLAHRNKDEYATPNRWREIFPRSDLLDHTPADSKPAVWWNVKYKNRWLSDGSIISGNPVITNILWNEIGRGSDLQELEDWIKRNDRVITELTTAVFASEAPRYTDFFPAESLSLEKAKHGEQIFTQYCAKCHGIYEKAWNLPNAAQLPLVEQLKTTLVRYKEQTKVVDVATDRHRYEGMASLEQLNNLAISKNNSIVVQLQKGYVPPPLVGIWARWPYFHNNSVPNLCAVLMRYEERPVKYYAGEPNDPEKDFDRECNGYPLGKATPEAWKEEKFLYDTRNPGMYNFGHDEGIFLKSAQELLTPEEKKALLVFLQTL